MAEIVQENHKKLFQQRFRQLARSVDNAIEDYLVNDQSIPENLREAMLYSLRAGGKRLRPIMVILACEACGGKPSVALPAATAMELVHTYSLIHDDLPAMDDDDFRRGQPSSHKVFGEGMAILAGDAMLTYAFGLLALDDNNSKLTGQLVRELAQGAGSGGMIGGQVADLAGENKKGNLDVVNYIHLHKTAMLFRAACRMGAWSAGAEPQTVDMLGDFGLKLGMAFQIVDDLLDITSTAEQLGKQTQKDARAGKITYPAIVGAEQSRRQVKELEQEALDIVASLGRAGENLEHLADMVINRSK